MTKIAIIGSKGFVGGAIYKALTESSKHAVMGATLDNFREVQKDNFDIVINCAMPSGRFWAKNNPQQDFIETVKKTADFLYGWKFKKFVQISTVSARCELDSIYGRHKVAAEALCNFGENLVVRLGVIYSEKNTKGPLVDMLSGKTVYMGGASRQSFIALDFCAQWIAEHLDRQGTVELGGKNAITLEEVAKHLGKQVMFEGEINHKDVENTVDELPQASEVFKFVDGLQT